MTIMQVTVIAHKKKDQCKERKKERKTSAKTNVSNYAQTCQQQFIKIQGQFYEEQAVAFTQAYKVHLSKVASTTFQYVPFIIASLRVIFPHVHKWSQCDFSTSSCYKQFVISTCTCTYDMTHGPMHVVYNLIIRVSDHTKDSSIELSQIK